MKFSKIYLYTIFILLFSMCAFAQEVRINISLAEQVYENVTFAEDFYMDEVQKFVLVDGKMNISNPSGDTVYDIFIDIVNTHTFDSNMGNEAGRNASQIGYIGTNLSYGLVSNITNNVTFVGDNADLDNDGNNNDYFYVNNTHILFNLSTAGFGSLKITDSDGNDANLTVQGGKSISLSEILMINGTAYCRFSVIGTFTGIEANNTLPASWDVQVKKLTNKLTIFIPELRANEWAIMNYTVYAKEGQGVLVQNPLNLETNYLNAYNTKILAGHEFVIQDTVTNEPPQLGLFYDIELINITMSLVPVSWNTSSFNFTFVNISKTGDYGNVFACNKSGVDCGKNVTANLATRSNVEWYWIPNNGTLASLESKNITYTIRAPDSVPTSQTYQFMTQDIYFKIFNVVSNLTVKQVRSAAELQYNLSKQIWNESSNESDHNVTWRVDAAISVPINITYNVSKVTLWVTYNLNPNNKTNLALNYSWSDISGLLNQTTNWATNTNTAWYFEYTDGSSNENRTPIIWMKPYYIVYNGYNQIINQSVTQVGKDLYMKYIYVVNGYWLAVDKQIINVDEDTYNITILVENIGNGYTPSGYVVQVYDFIPAEFSPSAWSKVPQNNMTTNAPEYNGTAYQWMISGISRVASLNASFAPRGDAAGMDKWNVTYQVVGNGDYRVSELYIVGLDPMRVDGAGASPLIAIKEGLSNRSYEFVFALIVIMLLAINVANLVMSQRIEVKLEKVRHQSKHYDSLKDEIDNLKKKLK